MASGKKKHRRNRGEKPGKKISLYLALLLAAICFFLLMCFVFWKIQHKESEKSFQTQKAVTTRESTQETIKEAVNPVNIPKLSEEDTEEAESREKATESTTEEEILYLQGLSEKEAGDVLQEEDLDPENMEQYFVSSEIDEKIFSRIQGLSYKSYCTVPKSDLRYLKVLHYNFDHDIQVGELITNVRLEKDMLEIFQELYEEEYEIEKMYLVDNYGADDTASIEVNNTSCFNFRRVTNGSKLSNHAGGCAIDINPQQNPYVTYDGSSAHWTHSNADAYIDRDGPGDHMIDHSDTCYRIFANHGFSWGGDWNNPKDYQHFEKKVVTYD